MLFHYFSLPFIDSKICSPTILAHDGGRIAINPTSDRMITSLMTAVDNDGMLYKATTYDDISDAFRLPLKGSG
jgi:hypothetical protein